MLVLTGPVENILFNGKESIRFVGCSSVLAFNLTKAKIEVMTGPLLKAVKLMEDDLPNITKDMVELKKEINLLDRYLALDNDTVKSVKRSLKTEKSQGFLEQFINRNKTLDELVDQVNEPDSKQLEVKKRFENSLIRKCKSMFKKGKRKCMESFADVFLDCLSGNFMSLTQFYCPAFYPKTVCNMIVSLNL